MSNEFSILGNNCMRKDAVEKVTGGARYIPDIKLPGMLYAKFLRCPYAHARIVNIDTSKAETLPGVKCVLTYKNTPKYRSMRKIGLMMDQEIYYPGQEVAAVAATSPEIAEKALELIDLNVNLEYEQLPAVISMDEALKPNAPHYYSGYDGNIYRGTRIVKLNRIDEDGYVRLEFGDIKKGFQEADFVLENEDETPLQYPCSPSPRSVVCEWAGEKLNCWADTQLPLFLLRDLSNGLGIPQSSIRINANHAVGGYGGKTPERTAVLAAIMSKRTGRPVRTLFSRAEDMIATHHRIAYKTYNKVGIKKDGTITARQHRILANWGCDSAYPYICQGTALTEAVHMLYRCPNTKGETIGVLTNTQGYGAMNGFGGPEAMAGIEKLMDQAAEMINMDPVEFRYKNCVRYGDRAMDYEQSVYGPVEWGIIGHDMDTYPELVRSTAEKAGWKEKWKGWRNPVSVEGPFRRGIGIALGMHHTSFWPSAAIVKMNQDGSAHAISGAVEIGQGFATIICQIVAETLGISYEDVTPIIADTGATPATRGNVASTGTSSAANAVKLAADDVKRQLFFFAAKKLDSHTEDLVAHDKRIWVKGEDRSVAIADICMQEWQITGTGNNPQYNEIKDPESGKTIHAYAGAVCVSEVEVDTETGKMEVLQITIGADTGVSINPIMVENQIDMSVLMGNGWARTEEIIIDPETGVYLNPNLLDYKLLTFLDMPQEADYQRIIFEKPCAWGPFGAKGFSETPITPVAPSLANAVYNAIGVRIAEGPLKPDVILRALERSGKQR